MLYFDGRHGWVSLLPETAVAAEFMCGELAPLHWDGEPRKGPAVMVWRPDKAEHHVKYTGMFALEVAMNPVEQLYDSDPQREWAREARHRTEFAVTRRALADYLPPSPAAIADLGGGPGRYAIPLTQQGYAVTLVDLSRENLAAASPIPTLPTPTKSSRSWKRPISKPSISSAAKGSLPGMKPISTNWTGHCGRNGWI